MVAQGSHASLGAYLNADDATRKEWLLNGQTKICVSVDSLGELFEILVKARNAGIPYSLILDAGHTEFKEPTHTAIAIGPADALEIDKITGELKLL